MVLPGTWTSWLVLLTATLAAPASASALCAVEGKLELVRLNLDEPPAFVVHVRKPNAPVPNAFTLERAAGGGPGEIPTILQMLALANPATTTVLAVGDLISCPEAVEIAVALKEGKGVHSGRLVRIFVKFR